MADPFVCAIGNVGLARNRTSPLALEHLNKGPPLEARAAVLVVDDGPLVRILTVQVLEEAGFRVEEAGNSEEALSRLNGHQIAALVTDIDMRGSLDGSGLACARSVQAPTTCHRTLDS